MLAPFDDQKVPSPLAAAWDRYWRRSSTAGPARSSPFVAWAADQFRSLLDPPVTVLDAGCGPGRDLCYFVGQSFSVVGIDVSSVAIRLAKRNLATLPPRTRQRATLVREDLRTFLAKQPASGFDAIFAAATYQSFQANELVQLFRELFRVLRPGGLHAYSIRPSIHPGASDPKSVAPNSRDSDDAVPLTFFDTGLLDRLREGAFEPLAWHESTPGPMWFVLDRKPRGS